jgi:hypothetical protein
MCPICNGHTVECSKYAMGMKLNFAYECTCNALIIVTVLKLLRTTHSKEIQYTENEVPDLSLIRLPTTTPTTSIICTAVRSSYSHITVHILFSDHTGACVRVFFFL